MNDEEVNRIHVNKTVRDEEIEAAEALLSDVDPGVYRVKDGAVVRYSGEPLTKPGTLLLFAKSYTLVPRLIQGIRTLETEVRKRWDEVKVLRREWGEEQVGREEDALRRSEGRTGPEAELNLMARYLLADAAGSHWREPARVDVGYVESLLRQWAGGKSVARELQGSVEAAEARAREHREAKVKIEQERDAELEALRSRLREAIEEVARGQIRDELKKTLRDAKRRLKAEAKLTGEGGDPGRASG